MGNKKQRQITIHFSEEHSHILDVMKRLAKENFRTVDQQIVYTLSTATEPPKVDAWSDCPEAIDETAIPTED